MTTPITGDLTKNKVYQTSATALNFAVVCTDDLGNAAAAINQAHLSGKQAGAAVVGVNFIIYIAEGSKPTDKWISQLAASGNIIPAYSGGAIDPDAPIQPDNGVGSDDQCLAP